MGRALPTHNEARRDGPALESSIVFLAAETVTPITDRLVRSIAERLTSLLVPVVRVLVEVHHRVDFVRNRSLDDQWATNARIHLKREHTPCNKWGGECR